MQKKKYYYAIAKGRKIGIFDNWDEVFKHTNRYPDNSKEKFDSYVAAQNWLKKQLDIEITTDLSIPKNGYAVDGACNQSTGEFQYQVYDLNCQSIKHTSKPYLKGTNNIAEFFAIICALKALVKSKSNQPIYSDSTTAIKWVKDRCCNTKVNDRELLMKISEQIEWLRSNNCPNPILKWETKIWGENPADFGRK